MTKFTLRPHQQRMLDSMFANSKGIIQCPTGGGKTFTMITDSRRFAKPGNVILVVFAPQLLLGQQLFNEFDYHLQDVDFIWRQVSSEGKTFQRNRKRLKFRVTTPDSATTSVSEIRESYRKAQKLGKPLYLFTTYKSLERVVESMIPITVGYFDEAHNCTASDNFRAVQFLNADHKYFFTATPKYSQGHNPMGQGMDNKMVYGSSICRVGFQELIDQNVIVRPYIHLQQSDVISSEVGAAEANRKSIVETVDYYEKTFDDVPAHKILFCADGTKSIRDLLDGGLVQWANSRGYKVMSMDSVNEGFVDGERGVQKGQFISKLNELGEDKNQKLLVFHYSMLGEGIDVKSFTGVVFLRRSLNAVFATQSIGRVIRACPAIGKTRGVVTIVQHLDTSDEVQVIVREIITALLEGGVPPEVFLNEEDGRGEEDMVIEELELEDGTKLIKNIVATWEHSQLLQEALNTTDDDLLSMVL